MARRSDVPNVMFAKVEGLRVKDARTLAREARKIARANAPKINGSMARGFQPYFGPGVFGISWTEDYAWYQEHGIHPFTMGSLAGKTIPMWITDPTGREREKNPKAKVRTTKDGRQQVLIFRYAAKPGERKVKRHPKTGKPMRHPTTGKHLMVPRSYPGAPGRIANREAGKPHTRRGKLGGQVARQNVGVRWRHPGLKPRHFLFHGITQAARNSGVHIDRIVARHPSGLEERVQGY